MSEKRMKPAIRFKGFTEDWEQRKVGELAEFNPKAELPETFEYVDLESVVGTEMISHREESRATAPSRAQRLARRGDLFYQTVRPYQKNNYLFEKPDNNYVFSTGYAQMRPRCDSSFLLCLVQTDVFVKYVLDRCTGTSYPAINANDLADMEISVPRSDGEQIKTGTFFRNLDTLITLYQRKYDKLVCIKKAMLDKMFPENGSCFPEIRFAGFTEAWERRLIGKMTNVMSASRVHKEEWVTEGVPFFRSSDVVSAYMGKINEKVFISFSLFEDLTQSSGKLEKDDILITGGGSIGIPFIVPDNKPLYSKDADLIWIKKSSAFYSCYLFVYFESQEFRNYIESISHVGTIAHYTIEQVKATPISVPTIQEQIRIGDFFRNLDRLITLQQQSLDKLKTLKKAFLEKMFV